jgi:hypothetical protein
MRRLSQSLISTVLLAAVALFAGCSADSPTPTSTPAPGGGASTLNLQLSTTNPNPKSGECTLIGAFATLNGSAVPDGSSIVFTTLGGAFAQNNSASVSLVTSGGSATAVLCAASEGQAIVKARVTLAGQTAQKSLTINFSSNGLPTGPFISQCADPSSGPVTGGTQVTIRGGGFGTDITQVRVFFRSGSTAVSATVTSVTDSEIALITPAFPGLSSASATPVEVDVVLGAGFTLSSPNCFTYTGSGVQPTVTAILPSSGTKAGGTRVSIFGTGFTAPTQVFFTGTSGALEAQVVSVTFNEIVAITPPVNAPGAYAVTVRNASCVGGGCTSNSVSYSYTVPLLITGFTPDHGDASTVVTIFGQGFVAPVLVTFGGSQGTVVSVTGTQILARPPEGCPSSGGAIAVTLLATGESASSSGTFTVDTPKITSGPIPDNGPGGSATAVTFVGTHLYPSGNSGALSVGTTGGTATVTSASEQNGQQTVVLSVTPDICAATVTLTFVNTATGCSTSASFTNSTFIGTGPTATIDATPGAGGSMQIAYAAETPTTGTPPYTYSWTFTNPDGSAANPATSTSQNPGTVTYNCTGAGCPASAPGTHRATLLVTDFCGKVSSQATSDITPP